jgi:hypothetical protein
MPVPYWEATETALDHPPIMGEESSPVRRRWRRSSIGSLGRTSAALETSKFGPHNFEPQPPGCLFDIINWVIQ